MATIESSGKTIVKIPMMVKRDMAEAIALEKETEYGEFYTLSIVSRSEGRQEDVQNQWNRFETGLKVSVPDGFRLMFFDHPQTKAAGYSLLGATPFFDDQASITIELFKLTEQDQLDLPFAAVLCRLEKIYHFGAPELKKEVTASRPSASKSKSRTAKKKRHSSSSEEEVPLRKGGTKRW